MPEPRKRRRLSAEERRDLIEQAAVEVFAERGYRGASVGEIARRSGVTVPVVYDHFASKLDLYRRLLERTRNELLEMWGVHLFGEEAPEVRIPKALEAWATYVEANRGATRMYFRDVSGDDDAEAVHKEVKDQARVALGVVVGRIVGPRDQEQLEMAGEVMRAGLVGLALWWHEHPHVPREQIVETAVEVLWRGYLSAAGQTIR
jgi:AcrR family transcriptional regulator